ncbi:hypothetical protein QPK32_08565 [Massilia sp. YIM B02763]|uniref:hypothetical protein n=1 Tax=Massilia sp. YIM B02763 TaxID=3050130 RepID=UPI0025B729DF|nr:hypothetical protein [Massilia sp. YIM B02763]MDN4053129.1 hypothetical protein [Massilia sp. YIM B02763]
MSAPLEAHKDMKVLTLTVKISRNLPIGIAESLEESLTKAVQILTGNTAFQDLCESADTLARLAGSQIRPGGILLEERIAQMATFKRVFAEGDWLTAEDINKLQIRPPAKKSLPASDWQRRGRIFSVSYAGKKYYPRYQFDTIFQPLPVIRQILKAYGECADTWALATWFHFPNGWIAKVVDSKVLSLAPKDALDLPYDVIKAARNQKGTYVA